MSLPSWHPAAFCDVVYALLAGDADATDRALLGVTEDAPSCREDLDTDLASPIGKAADADAALVKFLKGGALI